MLEKAARLIMIITFPTIVLLTSLQLIAFQPAYYERQFSRYQIEEATGMEQEDLLYTISHVIDYLAGKRDDLVVISRVRGEEREIFGDREKHHMEDVRLLFARGILLRNMALLLFAAGLATVAAGGRDKTIRISRAFAWSAWFPLGLGAIGSLLVASNFSYWFVVFHELLFDNDLWLLDPSREILIQMLPEGFFADTALLTAVLTVLVLLLTGLCASFLLRRLRTVYYVR
jgi:integral membrane protein (TIGR01906 family)